MPDTTPDTTPESEVTRVALRIGDGNVGDTSARLWLAGLAMQGILAGPSGARLSEEEIAREAVATAEATLLALARSAPARDLARKSREAP